YAHSRGILHRDLKPANVVLGDYGEVMVLDWGLSRAWRQPEGRTAAGPGPLPATSPTQTQPGVILGTPAYMAPEQAEGRLDQLDPRTDVYGLGAILFEVLPGRPPFDGPDQRAVLSQVRTLAPPRPRALARDTPAALEAVCLKALARRPADRYATAG